MADSKTSRDKADPISQLAMTDDKHRTRIFILIPKSMTDSELTLEFSQYGKVDHVQILKDKTTMESKVLKHKILNLLTYTRVYCVVVNHSSYLANVCLFLLGATFDPLSLRAVPTSVTVSHQKRSMHWKTVTSRTKQ